MRPESPGDTWGHTSVAMAAGGGGGGEDPDHKGEEGNFEGYFHSPTLLLPPQPLISIYSPMAGTQIKVSNYLSPNLSLY